MRKWISRTTNKVKNGANRVKKSAGNIKRKAIIGTALLGALSLTSCEKDQYPIDFRNPTPSDHEIMMNSASERDRALLLEMFGGDPKTVKDVRFDYPPYDE